MIFALWFFAFMVNIVLNSSILANGGSWWAIVGITAMIWGTWLLLALAVSATP